jgi:hypothetical protein
MFPGDTLDTGQGTIHWTWDKGQPNIGQLRKGNFLTAPIKRFPFLNCPMLGCPLSHVQCIVPCPMYLSTL